LGLLLCACGCLFSGTPTESARPARLLEGFDRSRAIIETSRNICLLLELYLADTASQQSRGLMYVEQLDENEGMLFRHSRPFQINMWMKNTYIPLDMLFIRSDGSIANIATNTTPLSTDRISSSEPVPAVLEMNAGFAQRWRVESGDRLLTLN
jgi:uncharacterized membrane protein (UPF0127 family)